MCCAETVIADLRSDQEAATKERDGALAEVETLRTVHSERRLEVTEQAQEMATLRAQSQMQGTQQLSLKLLLQLFLSQGYETLTVCVLCRDSHCRP